MSVTNSIEIRFERLAEEFAPPPAPKAKIPREDADALADVRVKSGPKWDRVSVADVRVKSGPKWDRVSVRVLVEERDELLRGGMQGLVIRQMADALVAEILKRMSIDREYRPDIMATQYSASLYVATEKPNQDVITYAAQLRPYGV